jgi:hypothetical protein
MIIVGAALVASFALRQQRRRRWELSAESGRIWLGPVGHESVPPVCNDVQVDL